MLALSGCGQEFSCATRSEDKTRSDLLFASSSFMQALLRRDAVVVSDYLSRHETAVAVVNNQQLTGSEIPEAVESGKFPIPESNMPAMSGPDVELSAKGEQATVTYRGRGMFLSKDPRQRPTSYTFRLSWNNEATGWRLRRLELDYERQGSSPIGW